MAEIKLDFYNEDGSLKPFSEFSSELESIYKQLEQTSGNQFMMYLTSPRNDFEPAQIINKFHFLDRKLYLNTEITETIAQDFLEKIQFWNAEDDFNETSDDDRGVIQLFINSPGGDLYATMQIVDTILNSKTPVVTVVTGIAYSGGFLIAIAGDHRMAFPHATFMFHEGSNMVIGDAHKTLQQSDFYKNMLKQMKKYVLDRTKIDPSVYDSHQKDDWYFTVNQALKHGVIDEICTEIG